MTKFIALLRGINVGGNKKVPMDKLKLAFEQLGFKNVKTILNTGNILFETTKKVSSSEIAKHLHKTFSFEIATIILPIEEIKKIAKDEPFKKIKVHDKIRLYVTFLPAKIKDKLKIPYKSTDGGFTIFKQTSIALFSILDLTHSQTPDAMNIIEKTYGKGLTTRNWNTVLKFLK